eukprot:6415043-Amphidinium_carterae.2
MDLCTTLLKPPQFVQFQHTSRSSNEPFDVLGKGSRSGVDALEVNDLVVIKPLQITMPVQLLG